MSDDALLQGALDAARDFGCAERRHRIAPEVDPATIRAHLREVYGDFAQPLSGQTVLADVVRMLREWNLHITHPRYFGLFNPSVVPASVAGDLLVAAFNPQLAAWSHAPAANEIERYTLAFFARRLGLPEHTVAHFTSGGAEANHTAFVVALADGFPEHVEQGLAALPRRPVVYASGESHHSLDKIARATGLGRSALRLVAVDTAMRIDVAALRAAIERDRAAGLAPFLVVATAGTTGVGAVDPLPELARLCAEERLWLHVDAAWGGAACLSPRLRAEISSIERADSVTWDAHKYLSVPMGAGMFFCSRPGAVRRAFEARTPYMPQPIDGTVDPYSSTLQWSRRHTGLKVFMALAALGEEGYRRQIEHQADMGDAMRAALRRRRFTVLGDGPLPVVCFTRQEIAGGRIAAADLAAWTVRQNFWVSPLRVPGHERPVLRACITSYATQQGDVEALAETVDRGIAELAPSS
ncbi:MAG: pyridoxal-dependent decarboxylase [Acidobacteria bacterium]|nr:MAG: pyridoxal-dependent decarboxylase [Acidobacteriota bacterium]REK07741.1 MAG: pyridoxal-dependent decarboxylase [Acidobacteriota bacterium]